MKYNIGVITIFEKSNFIETLKWHTGEEKCVTSNLEIKTTYGIINSDVHFIDYEDIRELDNYSCHAYVVLFDVNIINCCKIVEYVRKYILKINNYGVIFAYGIYSFSDKSIKDTLTYTFKKYALKGRRCVHFKMYDSVKFDEFFLPVLKHITKNDDLEYVNEKK